MLAAYTTEEQNKSFSLLGANSLLNSTPRTSESNTSISLLSTPSSGDSCLDSCSFCSEPSDATIISFGESCEATGTLAYDGGTESCGSIAYSGGTESCGSIASSSPATSCTTSCGGCSYSC